MFVVTDKHGHCCGCNDDITQPAEGVGNLSENKVAKDRRENDLAVIIYGNFSGGGKGICGGDGELTAGSCQTCQQKDAQPFQCHGVEMEDRPEELIPLNRLKTAIYYTKVLLPLP